MSHTVSGFKFNYLFLLTDVHNLYFLEIPNVKHDVKIDFAFASLNQFSTYIQGVSIQTPLFIFHICEVKNKKGLKKLFI